MENKTSQSEKKEWILPILVEVTINGETTSGEGSSSDGSGSS